LTGIALSDRRRPLQIATTHKNTDFDALASTFAATILYPGTVAVLPSSLNPNVRAFLSIHKDLFPVLRFEDVEPNRVNRLVVVDVNRWSRLGRIKVLREKEGLDILLWDHHTGEGDIPARWRCQEEMGATITLMIRHLKAENRPISPIQATLFLAGLYEDTGHLTFPSCRAEDAYAAAFLLENEADLNIMSSFLRPAYGEKQKDILFQMLQKAKRSRINGYAVSINKIEVKGHVDSLALVVRMYRDIVNVDAAFGVFVLKDRGHCMVIGRSAAAGLDVGMIMRSLGGGGHPGAGSAMLKNAKPEAVEQMIRSLIEGNQQASVQIHDLMSFPVFSVPQDASMGKVAEILRKRGCTGLPVVDGDRLVGMISRRDFGKIKKESQLSAPVKAFMSTDVKTIEPGMSPMAAARLMVKYDVGRLPVMEDGRIIGIVTRSDTMLYFYDLLPD
jgi:nanoRNase/pAp phosphatase (c-di-AMP/oligoRNAs hydrolase)